MAQMPSDETTMVAVSALRPGDEVEGVFACTRKDRLMTRGGSPYLALELRDKTGVVPARAFQDADALAGRFERGDVVRVAGRVERFRDQLVLEVSRIARVAEAEGVDPARFLPSAYRDLDELDGFLEHLAGEVYDRGFQQLLGGCSPTSRCAPPGVAPRARGPATTPTWAGCSSTRSRWPPWPTRPASCTHV